MIEKEAPCAHQGAYGHVECAVGAAAPVKGGAKKGEGFGVDSDGVIAGFAVDARELASGAVVAEERFDAVDLVERELHPLLCCLLVGRVQIDGKHRTHRRMHVMEEQEGFRLG